jgi:hypothetical protein
MKAGINAPGLLFSDPEPRLAGIALKYDTRSEMPFSAKVQEDAMVACQRHCCLCHRLKHTKLQCHHIVPHAEGGEDTFDNCIPLCLECHGEVEAYNPKHPIGTKYTPAELKRRRDEWYEAVKNPTLTVFNAKHVNIDRDMVKRLCQVCSPRTMKAYFCGRDYAYPFEKTIVDALGDLCEFRNRVESHFLDPALETLFAEFNARVLEMSPALRGADLFKEEDLLYFPTEYPKDYREHPAYIKKWERRVNRATNAARRLYKAYEELIHECRLRLEITTLDDLSKEDQQHEIQLSFIPISSRCYWSMGKVGDQPAMQIVTRWHVTNVPGSKMPASLLETTLLKPHGEVIQTMVHPSRTSPQEPYVEEIPEGKTGKFAMSFYLKSVAEPKSDTLEVKIAVVDQLGNRHTLDPITLKRRG